MPPARFEPTVSAGERPQTDTINHSVSGTGPAFMYRTEMVRPSSCLLSNQLSVYAAIMEFTGSPEDRFVIFWPLKHILTLCFQMGKTALLSNFIDVFEEVDNNT
jgi:hypothetical protein